MESAPRPLVRRRVVVGVIVAAGAAGLLIGTYEVCWSLLLHLRGAGSFEVGLSWTLFSIPFVALAGPAGWMADHLDRRWLTGVSLLVSAAFATAYPLIGNLALLIGLGALEAVAVTVAYPASLSLLSEAAGEEEMGRAQGLVASAQTAATALAAGGAGAAFGLAPWLPFAATAAVVAVSVASLPGIWTGVPGRVSSLRQHHQSAERAGRTPPSAEPEAPAPG